ncbi:DUF3152 domain-containing protein [Nocardioides sp. C4-1]|uniref:DUF3152 domain-containing protein n=1 Tax=Nocardioides sp. C4-1 TaxID=3151851 RepID=UPI0032636C60
MTDEAHPGRHRQTDVGRHRSAPGRRRAEPERRRGLTGAVVAAAVATTAVAAVTVAWPSSTDGPTTEATDPATADAAAEAPGAGTSTLSALRAPSPAEPRRPRPSQPTRPEEPEVPESASGDFDTAAQLNETDPSGATTYVVEVEVGLPISTETFAERVNATLGDDRSWPSGGYDLAQVGADDDADLRIVLASPETADSLCLPLDTGGRLSCRNGRDVVINAWRWFNGADAFDGDLRAYRQYVVNHEVGHALGFGHEECTGTGDLAPVMMQQTKGVDECRPNPWPAEVDLVR